MSPTRPADRYRDSPPLRRRATSLGLAVGLNLLILIALLGIGGRHEPAPEFKGGTVLIDLGRETPEVARTKVARAQPAARPRTAPHPPAAERPPVERPPMPSRNPLPLVYLSKDELASADIAKLGTQGAASRGEQMAASGDSAEVGTAPDGKPLYAAEWYRHPTDTELGGYLPRTMPPEGWGLVACKTAARYHVEDCVELGNSPPGSHLASAVRQAAWQFLVRPPRVGGKELVGTWVRIRIDYGSIGTADN